MNPTEQYINILENLKAGELGLLRTYTGQSLGESIYGFDLFTGLWWPLRQKNQKAPRREVAWLTAKLYTFKPIPHIPRETLVRQLGRCTPIKEIEQRRFMSRFDRLLTLPLSEIEPELRWAIALLDSKDLKLDWVRLTDDLSVWERESTRLKWAEEFLNTM